MENIGKCYYDYLDDTFENTVSIFYNGQKILPINILNPVSENSLKEITFNICYTGKEYCIRKSGDREWRQFCSTSTWSNRPFKLITKDHYQYATMTVYDINSLNSTGRKDSVEFCDKKIWVKIGKTYIFNEEFPVMCTNSVRVVLEALILQ